MKSLLFPRGRDFFRKTFLVFKKVYDTPTLPKHMLEFQLHPVIRIIRVLGGISFLLIMGNSRLNNPIWVIYIALFFNILFTVYHFYIYYHKVRHIYYLVTSDELEMRNSPLSAKLSAKRD